MKTYVLNLTEEDLEDVIQVLGNAKALLQTMIKTQPLSEKDLAPAIRSCDCIFIKIRNAKLLSEAN